MKKYKYRQILAAMLAGCLLFSGCVRNNLTTGVSIVEFDSVEELANIDRETLQNSANTLYKVGDDYYSFFPSTGQMELVTQVQEYDKQKITVIEALYNGTITADGTTPAVNESYVTSVTTLGSVLDTRTEYLERELDNCNANMLIDGADKVALTEYKAQLETELQQLTSYRQSLSNTAEIVVQSLQSQEVQDELVKQISALLDAQLVSLADQYAYNRDAGLVTDEDLASLEQTVAAQQEFIEILQGRYEDIDALLAEKRVTLDSAKDIVDTDAFKSVITQLDTYAASYVAECERLYNNLSTKAEALENLYATIQHTDGTGYTDVLQELRTQYVEMVQTQADLEKQIKTLSNALEGVELAEGDTADNTYSLLQTQLAEQEAELAALTEILANTDLATIDSLAQVQTALQERITSIENLQTALKETMTQEQVDALNKLKTELETSINSGNENLENSLQECVSTLTGNYDSLGTATQASIDELRSLLDSKTAEQSTINTTVNGLITNLGNDLVNQQNKLVEQKTALTNLINTTTQEVQSEFTTALESSIAVQEQKLEEQRAALEAFANSSDAELSETLQTLFSTQLSVSENTLNTAITELTQALADDSEATDAEIAALRIAVQEQFAEAVASAETDLAREKSTLETLIETQKNATIDELKSYVGQVDSARQEDINNLIVQLENSNNTSSTALNDAKTELKNLLDASKAEQESKLTAAKEALVAVMSQKDADLSATLSDKVTELDGNVQIKVAELLTALETEKTDRDDAIDTAKQAVTDALRTEIATQETALESTTNTLNTYILRNNSSVAALTDAHTALSGDLATLSDDVVALTNAYDAYTQTNTATVDSLNSALVTLDSDYVQYKEQTGSTITSIDTLLNTVKGVSDTNATNVANLQTAVDNLKDVTVANLQTVQTQLTGEVTTLSNTVSDNYTELSEQVTVLSENVSNLTTLTGTHDTKISALETSVGTLNTAVTALQTDLESLQTALADKVSTTDFEAALAGKADISDIPEAYTLPTATASDIGGVCVDNDTIKITTDGKIYVDTATVSQSAPGETVKVGTVWDNYEDIPAAYRQYCIQPNFVYLGSAPSKMFYKEVEEQWWEYSTDYSYTSPSDCPEPTATPTYGAQATTSKTFTKTTGTVWHVEPDRPATYKTISSVPVTVYYYGFTDGTSSGDIVWTRYAAKHNIVRSNTFAETTLTATATWTGKTVPVAGGGYYWTYTSTDTAYKGTRTYTEPSSDGWWGEYAKYGPDSGWKPSSYKGAYLAGCELTKAQRQKMWDAGVLTDFYPQVYDKTVAANLGGNYCNAYTDAKRNFINGTANFGNKTYTNDQTLENMPATLNMYGQFDTHNYVASTPYNVLNFTQAGLAYKLAYIYGNHVWIYVGTPT